MNRKCRVNRGQAAVVREIVTLFLAVSLLASGCAVPSPSVTVTPSATATATLTLTLTGTATPSATPTSTMTPAPTSTATPTPTGTPAATATATVTPTPTPHPMEPYTIAGLRERAYPGGTIEIQWIYTTTNAYTRYYITYPSDELSISGVLCIPHGDGPFPVVILNHGYISPGDYWSGADTWYASAHLAQQGYLTLSPDFRGWGESDDGADYFRTGLVVDALNLVSSLPSLSRADPGRVGMWGHSMGGGVTAKAMVIDDRIKAAVLYGTVPADDRVYFARWPLGRGLELPADPLAVAHRHALGDRLFLERTSPISYFSGVTAPVQIHVGQVDDVTPPRWSEAIRDELLAQGKEVEYYTYPEQGHAFHGDSWTLFMERVTQFFDRTLK